MVPFEDSGDGEQDHGIVLALLQGIDALGPLLRLRAIQHFFGPQRPCAEEITNTNAFNTEEPYRGIFQCTPERGHSLRALDTRVSTTLAAALPPVGPIERRSSLMHSSQISSLAGSFIRASSPVGRAFTTPFTRSSNLQRG